MLNISEKILTESINNCIDFNPNEVVLLEAINAFDEDVPDLELETLSFESVLKWDNKYIGVVKKIYKLFFAVTSRMKIKFDLGSMQNIDISKITDKPAKILYTAEDYKVILGLLKNIGNATQKIEGLEEDMRALDGWLKNYDKEDSALARIFGTFRKITSVIDHWINEAKGSFEMPTGGFLSKSTVDGFRYSDTGAAILKASFSLNIFTLIPALTLAMFYTDPYLTDNSLRTKLLAVIDKMKMYVNHIVGLKGKQITKETLERYGVLKIAIEKIKTKRTKTEVTTVKEKEDLIKMIQEVQPLFYYFDKNVKLLAKTNLPVVEFKMSMVKDQTFDKGLLEEMEIVATCYKSFFDTINTLSPIVSYMVDDLRAM